VIGCGVDRRDESAGGGADLWPLGTHDQLAHVVGIMHRYLGKRVTLVWRELQHQSTRLGHLVQPTNQLYVLRLNLRISGRGARAARAR
jgi:hypothetical protein